MRRIRKRKHIFESKCRTTWVQREGDPLVGKKGRMHTVELILMCIASA